MSPTLPTPRIRASGALPGGLAVAVLAASCVGPANRPVPEQGPSRAPDLVLPAALAGAPREPGPGPRHRSFDAVGVNARCESCHAEIAGEWRASLHRSAHTDPVFLSQLVREPFPFCKECHAPEARPEGEGQEALRDMGVGCVTCHVVGDTVLAVSAARATAGLSGVGGSGAMGRDGEHHALLRTPVFEGAAACKGCHEFAFPDSASSRAPVLMQATIQEHAASARAGERCAECHMPVVRTPAGQHRSHVFAASRDETFVRSAIRVEMAPFEDHTLVLTLHPGAVGHAFPTGDMLRRLRFLVEELDAEGRVIEGEQRLLARHFGFSREPGVVPRRVLRKDDRVGVGPGPVVLRYAVGSLDRAVKLRYSLRYERVSDPIGEDGAAVIDGSVSLAEGTISLQGTPP